MINEDDLEKEMLEDLDFLYQSYRKLLEQKTTNVRTLNILIRALKEVHNYHSIDNGKENNQKGNS